MLADCAAFAFSPVALSRKADVADGGPRILARLLDTAAAYVSQLHEAIAAGEAPERIALLTRIRGTGPGVSFSALVERLRAEFPIPLESPFEESENVAGAVLEASRLLDGDRTDALLLL